EASKYLVVGADETRPTASDSLPLVRVSDPRSYCCIWARVRVSRIGGAQPLNDSEAEPCHDCVVLTLTDVPRALEATTRPEVRAAPSPFSCGSAGSDTTAWPAGRAGACCGSGKIRLPYAAPVMTAAVRAANASQLLRIARLRGAKSLSTIRRGCDREV